MVFKKGELFSGPGGLSYGAISASISTETGEKYSIEHIWANDNDEDSCKTFRKNICPENPESVINKNVDEIDIKKLKKIDCFVFGFPCNDYSDVGKKKGIKGDYGKLYKYGIKVLDEHNPKWFLAENVTGLKSTNNGDDFNKILNELENAGKYGYELTAHLYKFEEYGVPQFRNRIIIVGIRKDLKLKFKVPAPTTKDKHITSKEAISDIPDWVSNNELPTHKKGVIEKLKHIPEGKNIWCDEVPEELKIKTKVQLSQIYRRLDSKRPSYTITASGGGGTHGYHWKENRALTNRERARIQTFPDEFEFFGKKESVRKQIGMAVPPKGAKVIFEAILKTFAGISYESVPEKYNIPKDEFRKKSSLLFDTVYDLKEMFIDNELKLWQTIVVSVNEDMKLTINFDYTKWFGSAYTPMKRHEYYCYKYLGKVPEDKKQEELFKEMEEYRSKFNK